MISTRRKTPRLSLDDLVDELIENPSADDTQLIGDVRADNAKSSRMVKGQADLLELNAWIDNHNELPSLDSSDFTERKLARRMNGYAHAAADHADLKPFDKHDLIDFTLYQKPAPKPDLFFEDDIPAHVDVDTLFSLDLGDAGESGLSAEYSETELASTTDDYESMVVEVVGQAKVGDDSFIDGMPDEDRAWLTSLEENSDAEPIPSSVTDTPPAMNELPPFDVTEPLSTISSPAISAAAAAIIKLRARKRLLAERALLDSDIDAALASDSVLPVTDSEVTATELTDIGFINNPAKAIGAGRHDVVSAPLEVEITSKAVVESLTALEPQFEVQAQAQTEPVVGANHVTDLPVEVEGRVAVDSTVITATAAQIGMEGRIINPSYMSVLYQATPNAKSYDDISYVKKYTPYVLDADQELNGDDIDELQIPFANIPLADQLPANYHDNLIDYYGITGISEDDLLASNIDVDETLPLMVEGDVVTTPVAATAPSADNVEASIIDTTYKKLVGKYDSTPVYWSIDGEYDLDVVNSDYATGLTQRHNPNPPMTATKPNSTPNPNSTSVAAKNTSSKPSPSVATANPPMAAAKPTTTKPSAAAGTTDTDDGFSLTATKSDNIATSQPTSSNIPVEREVEAVPEFASLDDILADDDDFLSSLCLEEDHLFDLESKYTDVGDKATPDEVGKQTHCDDFYMYEAHFKALHDKLESGELKTTRYTATTFKEGDAFILNGMVGFIQSFGEHRENYAGVYDPRLRLIFDNGTESNILLLSLSRNLYSDKTGRLIIRSADDFTDFDNLDRPTKIRTGQVYIVRSLSNDPALKQIPNLYKIGFTKGTVEERTKNALRDTAFLESPVEVVTKAECYDLDPRGLEGLIHDFLHSQRINITLTSKNGSQYHPQEWFSVGLDEAKKVITHIINGTIVDYRMDNTTNRVVAK